MKQVIKSLNIDFIYYFIVIMMSSISLSACEPRNEESSITVPPIELPDTTPPNDETEHPNYPPTIKEMTIKVDDEFFTATLTDSSTARDFATMLPMTITMNELNGNEKYYYLPVKLTVDSFKPDLISSGDIMLFGNNCLVIFYDTLTPSYNYTPIGRVDNPAKLKQVLGNGDIEITLNTKVHK